MRKICYVTGTRADFGLVKNALLISNEDPRLSVSVCITGNHFNVELGETYKEIRNSGLRIAAEIPVEMKGESGAEMAIAISKEIAGITSALESEKPDMTLVLGDRGEMLAAAIASLHLNIPVVHIHGGERSGTIDESVRHAITKLSHYHLVSTEGARDRLIRMGEKEESIFVTGAPGLDDIFTSERTSKEVLCKEFLLDPERPVGIVIFHPVHQEQENAGAQMRAILDGIQHLGIQALVFKANTDAGGASINREIENSSDREGIKIIAHLERDKYLAWLSVADIMIGNSSSGIIEAASYGLPVLNVGSRQDLRERNANTQDVPVVESKITEVARELLSGGRLAGANIYGDGKAGERIAGLLASISIDRSVLNKVICY